MLLSPVAFPKSMVRSQEVRHEVPVLLPIDWLAHFMDWRVQAVATLTLQIICDVDQDTIRLGVNPQPLLCLLGLHLTRPLFAPEQGDRATVGVGSVGYVGNACFGWPRDKLQSGSAASIGAVSILQGRELIWSKACRQTTENNPCYGVADIEKVQGRHGVFREWGG